MKSLLLAALITAPVPDKQLHIGVSTLGTLTLLNTNSGPYNRLYASTTMFMAGLLKEQYDRFDPARSYEIDDIRANTVGILTANLLYWEF